MANNLSNIQGYGRRLANNKFLQNLNTPLARTALGITIVAGFFFAGYFVYKLFNEDTERKGQQVKDAKITKLEEQLKESRDETRKLQGEQSESNKNIETIIYLVKQLLLEVQRQKDTTPSAINLATLRNKLLAIENRLANGNNLTDEELQNNKTTFDGWKEEIAKEIKQSGLKERSTEDVGQNLGSNQDHSTKQIQDQLKELMAKIDSLFEQHEDASTNSPASFRP